MTTEATLPNIKKVVTPSAVHQRCGRTVSYDQQEVTPGYVAACPSCDEDLFSFEITTAQT